MFIYVYLISQYYMYEGRLESSDSRRITNVMHVLKALHFSFTVIPNTIQIDLQRMLLGPIHITGLSTKYEFIWVCNSS